MADVEWIENMKKIIRQAEEAACPCDVILGTVTKIAPLEVQIGPKTLLNPSQVFLPQHLTDYATEMILPNMGTVTATINNSLKAGDQILLIQKRGGQQYVAIDRWQKG